MNYIFLITLFLVSLGQLQRVSFLGGQVNIYLFELLMILYVAEGLWVHKNRLKELFNKRALYPYYLFIAILGLSLVNRFYQYGFIDNLVGFLYFGRIVLYLLLFYLLIIHERNWGNWGSEGYKK